MAMKATLLVVVLVVLVTSQAEAQGSSLSNLFNVGGTVFCPTNGSVIANATTPTLPFANALVQVLCGGKVISSALTNGSGVFDMVVSPLQIAPLTTLLSASCNVVVPSQLSSCNSTLPSTRILQAPLQQAGTVARGLYNVGNLNSVLILLIALS